MRRFAVGQAEECAIGSYVSVEDYRELEARYNALVQHLADRAALQPPAPIVLVQRREHLAHCPAHPFIAQCICDEVPT